MSLRNMTEVIQEHRDWAASQNARAILGFRPFDSRSGGVAPGELVLFLARSSVGKTVWMLNVVHRQRHMKMPTVIYSLEMSAGMIAQNLAAITYGVPTHAIELEASIEGHSTYMDALERDYPHLLIEDNPSASLRRMREGVAEVEGCRFVFVDHLELVKGGRAIEEQGNVRAVAQELKTLSKDQGVTVVCLQQVSRGEGKGGDEPLGMTSGRFGGEEAADYILAAYRPALRKGITANEFESLKEHWYLQYLKTRSGGETHPSGVLYRLNEQMQLLAWSHEAGAPTNGAHQ